MESAILNLARGNRLSMYMGLQMLDGLPVKYSPDYAYVEVPLKEFYNPSDEKVTQKALRNQHVQIIPACSVNVRGHYRVLVKTNPALQAVSNCPTVFILDVGEGEQPTFYATMRKDLDAADISWAIRLYMIA